MAAVLEEPGPQRVAPPPGGAPIVRITALRKSYGAHEVLKGIDLDVLRGEVVAIIGKSGSGKSTLLRCINGLEVFQEGALTVDGKPLLHESAMAMRELRQRVGMIFQGFNLFPHLSVGRNIMLAPMLVKHRLKLQAASQALFGKGDVAALDEGTLLDATAELPGGPVDVGTSVTDALVAVGLVDSRNAARRAISEGGASLNNVKLADPEQLLREGDFLHGKVALLRRGRKSLAAGRRSG